MITEEIRKYILEGKWESEYPRAIEHLLTEVKQLHKGIQQLYDSIGAMETQGNIAIRKELKEMIE